jgi:hypothetical protein
MTARKLFILLLLAFIAGGFAALLVASMQPRDPELHELSGKRLVAARGAFNEYRKNNIIQLIDVPLIEDYKLHVAIVQEFRGVAYGFVQSYDLPNHFWARRTGLTVYRYDDQHLFVILSDWLVTDIERGSAAPVRAKKTHAGN